MSKLRTRAEIVSVVKIGLLLGEYGVTVLDSGHIDECPICDESNDVSEADPFVFDDTAGLWCCDRCESAGDVVDLISSLEGTDTTRALWMASNRAD
jgi:hypothetical protein